MVQQVYSRPHDIASDVDLNTRWWTDYRVKHFSRLARPCALYNDLVTESFFNAKKLARSVSASRFDNIREAEFETPRMHRSPSISVFSPSDNLKKEDRVAPRLVSRYKVYKPKADTTYYHKHLMPHKTQQLLKKVQSQRPPVYMHTPISKAPLNPELEFTLKRIYHDYKVQAPPPLQDAYDYINTYLGSRIRSVGYSLPFIYTTYDRRYYEPYDRHIRHSNVFYTYSDLTPIYRHKYSYDVPRTIVHSVATKYAYKPTRGRCLYDYSYF